jgi:hypothetical protein
MIFLRVWLRGCPPDAKLLGQSERSSSGHMRTSRVSRQMWRVKSVTCEMCDVWNVWRVEYMTCGICDVWNVWRVECVTCGMCDVWNIWRVECVTCEMCVVWNVWRVEYVTCGMYDVWNMWRVEYVTCGIRRNLTPHFYEICKKMHKIVQKLSKSLSWKPKI